MHKVIFLAVAALSFAFGFLLCAFFFVWSVENTDKWGDLATWTGSGVAFLALIAAIIAAWLSKRAADQSIEKNTLLSLHSIVNTKTSEINKEFLDLITNISKPSQKFSKQKLLEYFTYGFQVSFSQMINIIDSSVANEEDKNLLKKGFISSLSYYLIDEIITGSPTAILRTGDSAAILFGKNLRQLYEPINVEIRRLGMYETLTECADRNHL